MTKNKFYVFKSVTKSLVTFLTGDLFQRFIHVPRKIWKEFLVSRWGSKSRPWTHERERTNL